MEIQTMASQGGGGGGRRQSRAQSLGRQGSLYGLTLNEVQSHLGEPLLSMNLDELLKNVLPAEPSQLSFTMDASSQYAPGLGLQRQGSTTMPGALSKKTVDEVWRDIQRGSGRPTLGEMTLEDFLVRAGVVAEGSDKRSDRVGNAGNTESVAGVQGFEPGGHWLQQYQQQAQQRMMGSYVDRPVPQPPGVGASNVLHAVYHDGRGSNPLPRVGSMPNPQTPGRKRGAGEDVAEKTVERRQKRMIKNRESAARSRARKQAYTNELENKISLLEEENERLKQQKELESVIHYVPQPEPRYQLRRTNSATF